MSDDWVEVLQAVAAAGADADRGRAPVLGPDDGRSGHPGGRRCAALARGTTSHGDPRPSSAAAEIGVPVAVMTYYNLVFRAGHRRFAALAGRGRGGRCDRARPPARGARAVGGRGRRGRGRDGAAWSRPSTPPDRVARDLPRGRGASSTPSARMGVTGERDELGADAPRRWSNGPARCSDLPIVRRHRDLDPRAGPPGRARWPTGWWSGSALVRRLLDGGGPEGAAEFVASCGARSGPEARSAGRDEHQAAVVAAEAEGVREHRRRASRAGAAPATTSRAISGSSCSSPAVGGMTPW